MSASARAQQPADDRVPCPENTVFLIPDEAYTAQVIKGYLRKKYANIPQEMIVSQINMQAIPHLAELQFVLVVRRPSEGERLGPAYTLVTDQFGKRVESPIAPETYHREVVESPPIRVRDHVKVARVNLFQATETKLDMLIDELAKHASPYRIFPQNKPDFLIRCMVAC